MGHNPLVMVVKELCYFVIGEIRQCLPVRKLAHYLPAKVKIMYIDERVNQHLLLVPKKFEVIETASQIDDSDFVDFYESAVDEYLAEVGDLQSEFKNSPHDIEFPEPQVMYVIVPMAICILTPYRDFDNVLANFPYGTAVTVTGYQDSYAKVFWSHHEGWIQKDYLSPQQSQVWPQFFDQKIYLADNNEVQKLRMLIGDVFHSKDLDLPLQAGEWVVYRLREQNRTIPWPVVHGRVPGDWQTFLKGVDGIHIGLTPKIDTIMEWRGEDSIGRVAYVERVTLEQVITITVVGFEESGCYEERVIKQEEWRELRPIFIEMK